MPETEYLPTLELRIGQPSGVGKEEDPLAITSSLDVSQRILEELLLSMESRVMTI